MVRDGVIDGWHIYLDRQDDLAFPWRADAFNSTWDDCTTASGFDPENTLSQLALKMQIDRKRLLAVFGL